MVAEGKGREALLLENRELRRRLREAEERLHALPYGEKNVPAAEESRGGEGLQAFREKGYTCRALVEAMAEGAVVLSPDGIILYTNTRFASMLGFSPASVTGASILDHIASTDLKAFHALLEEATACNARGEITFVGASGELVPSFVSLSPLATREIQGGFVVVADRSRQRCNEVLVASEKLAYSLFDQAAQPIVVCDEHGLVVRISRIVEDLCIENPVSKPFDSVFALSMKPCENETDTGKEWLRFSVASVLKGEVLQGAVAQLTRPDGRFCELLLSASPLISARRGIFGCVVMLDEPVQALPGGWKSQGWRERLEIRTRGQIADLVESDRALHREKMQHKRTEEALRESEARFRTIFENAGIGMALIDLEGHAVAINPALTEMFGCDESEATEALQTAFLLAIEVGNGSGFFGKLAAGERDRYELEKRFMRVDGRLIWCLMSVSLIRDARGRPYSAVVMFQDILQRKLAEKALKQSEARYRAIVEDQVELVSRFLPDLTVTFVNEAYCRYFGLKSEQFIGKSLFDLVPKKSHERLKEHFASLSKDNPVACIEHRTVSRRGCVRWQQWTDRAILDEQGRVKEIQSVGRDITARKNAEKALQESEKRLRHLSSQLLTVQEKERKRIAHELHDSVGQYLSAVKYGLEACSQHSGRGKFKAMAKSLETLVPMVRHAIEEVRRIYMDLRPSLLDDLGIVATINWFCREFQGIYNTITIEKHLWIEEAEVPEQLKIIIFRIIQEALNNIAKHSGAGGVQLSLKQANGTLDLVIEDNGQGFDPAALRVNRKSRSGLGLASMRERAELSGGVFKLESCCGNGTRIRVTWPFSPERV